MMKRTLTSAGTVRRVLSMLLVLVLFCGLPLSVGALTPTTQPTIEQQTIDRAYALNGLGLFQGTENGFELEKRATRLEGLVMLIRLLGEEQAAQAGNYPMPFTDVPTWGVPYVGYAYQNGLTKGTSSTNFSSTTYITANDYATFALRALGYSDTGGDFVWQTAAQSASQFGIVSGAQLTNWNQYIFVRGDMVDISFASLKATLKGSSRTMAQKLAEKDIFTQDAAKAAGVWTNDSGPVTTFSIAPATAFCSVGGTVTLTATGATGTVQWTSGSPNATVTPSGASAVVTGVSAGTAIITATSAGQSAAATVTIQANGDVSVQSVSLSKTSLSLEVGKSASVSVSVLPDNASNKNVNWSSGNPAVATVAGGNITAIAAGTTTITAASSDGSGKSASLTVTVAGETIVPPPPPSGVTVVAERENLPDGCYRILPVSAPNCIMDLDNFNPKPTTNIRIATDKDQTNQRFNVLSVGGSNFKLSPILSKGTALDVSGSTAVGSNIQIWSDNGTDNQKFFATKLSNDNYILRMTAQPDIAVGVASATSGGNVKLVSYNPQDTQQQWSLIKVAATRWDALLADGLYTLTLKEGGRNLDVYGRGDNNGAKVDVWTPNETSAQTFRIKYVGDGKYKLYAYCSNQGNGRVLDVNRGANASGPLKAGLAVDLWDENDAPAQEFEIWLRDDGYYTLMLAALPDHAVTCSTASSVGDGAPVTLEKYAWTTMQHWKITPTGKPTDPPGESEETPDRWLLPWKSTVALMQSSGPAHNGATYALDFALSQNGIGLYAPCDGVVLEAGWSNVGYGNYVLLQPRDSKYKILLGHMANTPNVKSGDALVRGQTQLGIMGRSGNSSGIHVHIEVRGMSNKYSGNIFGRHSSAFDGADNMLPYNRYFNGQC